MNPYIQQYRQIQVNTVDGGRLVLMVYEGAMGAIKMAKSRIEESDLQGKSKHINRAIGLVGELITALDWEKGGEVTPNLNRLYIYVEDLLTEANIKNTTRPLDVALRIMNTLYEGWSEVFKGPILAESTT